MPSGRRVLACGLELNAFTGRSTLTLLSLCVLPPGNQSAVLRERSPLDHNKGYSSKVMEGVLPRRSCFGERAGQVVAHQYPAKQQYSRLVAHIQRYEDPHLQWFWNSLQRIWIAHGQSWHSDWHATYRACGQQPEHNASPEIQVDKWAQHEADGRKDEWHARNSDSNKECMSTYFAHLVKRILATLMAPWPICCFWSLRKLAGKCNDNICAHVVRCCLPVTSRSRHKFQKN